MRACLLIMAMALLMAGCGQKGPLYLPDESSRNAASQQEG
ncbi:LPS translocon maturation chaperone LptM [Vreelandella sp. EE22]